MILLSQKLLNAPSSGDEEEGRHEDSLGSFHIKSSRPWHLQSQNFFKFILDVYIVEI